MNNTVKIIIHIAIIFLLAYLWVVGYWLAQFIIVLYLLALFFESKLAAGYSLFFIFLLPIFIFGEERSIAEHYAISAYIFLSGSAVYTLIREHKFTDDFMDISYSQILYLITGEKQFADQSRSSNLNEMARFLVISSVFLFLLFSPLFNFLLTDIK